MKKFLESQPIQVLSVTDGVLTSLVAYIQLYQTNFIKDFASMAHLIVILKAAAFGIAAYLLIYILIIIVKKVIAQGIEDLTKKQAEKMQSMENDIKELTQLIFIHDIINLERTTAIYPDIQVMKDGRHQTITTMERVIEHLKSTRENFRVNKDDYKISLDVVEAELKRMFGHYYEHELNPNK